MRASFRGSSLVTSKNKADRTVQWLAPDSTEDMIIVLSASDTGDDYMLDRVFFENWYGLWHDAVMHHGGEFDWIQLLCVSALAQYSSGTG